MLPRYRRIGLAALALGIMVAASLGMQKPETPEHTFRIVFGLKDKMPGQWDGQVTVADGDVTSITGWRFEEKDAVQGTSGWKCKTRNYVALDHYYRSPPGGGKETTPPQSVWPNGVTLKVKGAKPTITVNLPGGDVKFAAGDVTLGEPKKFLGEQVSIERLPYTALLRPAASPKADDPVQDDYPAFWVRYKTAKHYLAWVAYQKEKDRVLLVERDGPKGKWTDPIEVSGVGDHFRVAIAGTHDDTIWIVWSAQRDKAWNLFGRSYKDGKLGPEVRLTEGAGPNIWQRMTTDSRGRAWLVWQGFKEGTNQIYARCVDGDGWHDTINVSEVAGQPKGNCWDPTIAADNKDDRVWIGWDGYGTGNYQVHVRSLAGGPKPKIEQLLSPASSPNFQAHVSLASDRDGRLWAAWDEAGKQWGKDTGYLYQQTEAEGLYHRRNIAIQCLVDGKWQTPAQGLMEVLPPEMRDFHELPQLQVDVEGRMWLAFRYRTVKRPRIDGWAAMGRWDIAATAYLGDRWLPVIEMPQSGGRNDMRASSQRDREGNVYFAYASDNRGWVPPSMPPRNHSVAVSQLTGAAPLVAGKFRDVAAPAEASKPVHPQEKEQVARIRNYKIETGGKAYHIYRGDLHRHTDISSDGIGDGTLMDLHRYGIDAAAMDYIIVSDHNMGNENEYCWWRTQKANDLYTLPSAFISVYGYERSVPYPNGHRNVIWPERGHRTLPLPQVAIPKQMAEDTTKLYAYLRRTNGICTLHTPATGQGTNWEEKIDSELEPFVELFQGFHASFEAPGAPRIVDEKSDVVHTSYKADGYVSRALANGYRLGFQASSDHVSTHVSYACVLAEDFSRKGLVEAMKKRHTYAATDNIILDVRIGNLGIMGDEVRTAKPGLDVNVHGTGPIDRVDVIRNGEVVHTVQVDKNSTDAKFHWDDPAPVKGEKASHYYVRIVQKDGQMAWSSPMWVVTGN